MQYISHVERMAASVLYWKGIQLRNTERYPNLEAWFSAFEARGSYMATKSDYYTHIMDIPPQYGPAYSNEESKAPAAEIDGSAGSWELPLPPASLAAIEPVTPHLTPGLEMSADEAEEAARHEAARKVGR